MSLSERADTERKQNLMRTDQVVIYRKNTAGPKYNTDTYSKAPTKGEKTEANEALELIARVSRPELVEFLNNEFYNMTALDPKVIDNKGLRLLKHRNDGWIVPVGSLGRKGEVDRSAAQSIVLWIKQNCGHLVNPDHVSVVVQPMDV